MSNNLNQLVEESKELTKAITSLQEDQSHVLSGAINRIVALNASLLEIIYEEIASVNIKMDALLEDFGIECPAAATASTKVTEVIEVKKADIKPPVANRKVYTVNLSDVNNKLRSRVASVPIIKQKLFFFEKVRRILAGLPSDSFKCEVLKVNFPKITGYIHKSPRQLWRGFAAFKRDYNDFIEGKGVWGTFDVRFTD